MKNNDIHNYDDIIDLPHPISKNHKPMQREKRAAQFAPFAALTGHKEIIVESSRLTKNKKILDENEKMLINIELSTILECIKERPTIKVTYFKEDTLKNGGTYVTITHKIKNYDEVLRALKLIDGTMIKVDDILSVEKIK